jgi:hypothetical protein
MRRRPVTCLFGFADLVCTSVRCSDWRRIWRHGLVLSSLPLLILMLALAPAAHASTNLYVNGAKGSDSNNCKTPQHACKTIGHAIALASSGDTVKVAPSTYKENLDIGISLNILGANARTTIVDGNQSKTVFTISKGVVVSFSGLTIENGSAAGGYAGGIVNEGTLTISRCTITGNNGSGGYVGGIFNNFGTTTVTNSTITGNSASGGYVGGIFIDGGTATFTNSTITGNSVSGGYVGGIFNYNGGTTTVSSSTITGNSASGGYAGGIFIDGGTTTFQNTIMANSGANCSGTVSSEGYNLSSDGTCNFNGKGDKNNTEPKLGTLGYHGGPTQTFPELLKSPTVDKGNPSGCTDGEGHKLTTDQRGYPRPGKDKHHKRCDMGAYERQTD